MYVRGWIPLTNDDRAQYFNNYERRDQNEKAKRIPRASLHQLHLHNIYSMKRRWPRWQWEQNRWSSITILSSRWITRSRIISLYIISSRFTITKRVYTHTHLMRAYKLYISVQVLCSFNWFRLDTKICLQVIFFF